tara:strand:+ start:8246 stop:8458 length:213 start_codon:yes stop_codon:yes gene_type:complete
MGVVVPKLGLFRVGEDLSYSAIMAMLEPVERQLQRKVNPTLYSPEEFAERLAAQKCNPRRKSLLKISIIF